MSLSKVQLSQFLRHGFTSVNKFWTENEISKMKEALEELVNQGKLYNISTQGDGKTLTERPQNLQLCPLMPEHKLFASLPFHPRVQGVVTQLLGPVSISCHLSQAFWKPPLEGAGTCWHQDNAYFKLEDGRNGVAMWTAVHDSTIHNGTLHVIPGLHTKILHHQRVLEDDHHIGCGDDINENEAVPVEVPAGGAVFFHYNVPHCTKPNLSPFPRAAVAYHFVRTDAIEVDRLQFDLQKKEVEFSTPVVVGPDVNVELVNKENMVLKKWADMQIM